MLWLMPDGLQSRRLWTVNVTRRKGFGLDRNRNAYVIRWPSSFIPTVRLTVLVGNLQSFRDPLGIWPQTLKTATTGAQLVYKIHKKSQ